MPEEMMPEPPGKLEFKPDRRHLERLARFRRVVLLVTVVMVAAGFFLVIGIQPKWVFVDVGVRSRGMPEVEPRPAVEAPPPAPAREARTVYQAQPLELARGAAAGVDTAAGSAVEMWRRAEGMVLAGDIERDGAAEILTRLSRARALNDSARDFLRRAQEGLERLRSALAAPGVQGLRVSAAFAAGRDYLNLVSEEARDRQGWLDACEMAVRAFAGGDRAEYEIKGNVAGGYLRKCEVRRRKLERAAGAFREARSRLVVSPGP